MTKLPDFDRILYLVEHHGEPDCCPIKKCSVCVEINAAGKIYNGSQVISKNYYVNKPKFRYIVIDEHGREFVFNRKADIARHVRTTGKYIDRIINTGKSYKGFTVTQDDI